MMHLKKRYFIVSLISIFIVSFGYIYKNIPLRTAIYRSFYKQSTYIISEGDTIYSFGYFGVRKQVLENNGNLRLLAENDSFCHNCFVGHLIGRSGVIKGDYLYVATRSYLGGRWKSNSKGYQKGMLLIMCKSNLRILKRIEVDYSMIEAKIYKNVLVVSGLQGFDIYDIGIPLSPQLTHSFRTNKLWEFQGCEFINADTALYVAFARWSDGLSIYNITNPSKVCPVANLAIQDTLLPQGLQTFCLKYIPPYLYSSLAPVPATIGTEKDRRGIIVYDLSDINNITREVVLIPRTDWYQSKIGDPQPSHIGLYEENMYKNFGEKGVAVFDVKDAVVKYKGIIKIPEVNKILPLHITEKGILLVGDYKDGSITSFNLNKYGSI